MSMLENEMHQKQRDTDVPHSQPPANCSLEAYAVRATNCPLNIPL